jgi:hypothetical protein
VLLGKWGIYVSKVCYDRGLWINGEVKRKQILGPSLFILYHYFSSTPIICVIGSVKDADLTFERYVAKYGYSNRKHFVIVHYKFADKRPMAEVLKGFPEEYHDEIMRKINYAKMLCGGNVKFRVEPPLVENPLKKLSTEEKRRLKTYTTKFFPRDQQLMRDQI